MPEAIDAQCAPERADWEEAEKVRDCADRVALEVERVHVLLAVDQTHARRVFIRTDATDRVSTSKPKHQCIARAVRAKSADDARRSRQVGTGTSQSSSARRTQRARPGMHMHTTCECVTGFVPFNCSSQSIHAAPGRTAKALAMTKPTRALFVIGAMKPGMLWWHMNE